MTRREFARLLGLGAAFGAVSGLTACAGPSALGAFDRAALSHTYQSSFEPLKTGAASNNLLFGAATGTAILQSDPSFATQFATHCGLLVPENELKWDTVEPQPNVFNFGPGDWLAEFAAQNRQVFRGHCLVWHEQIPSWAGTGGTAAAEQQLTNHVYQTVSHYAGRMHSWDVVNEAVYPRDGRSDGLRKTVWLESIGPSYIELAFRTAAQADPAAILVYNETGLEYDTSDADARRSSVLKLLTGLKAAGAPVHALGIQGHLSGDATNLNATKLLNFIRQVAGLGLKIFVSELDVIDQRLPADIPTRDAVVANAYSQFLSAVLQEPTVEVVITWGLSDRFTWLSSFKPRSDGLPVRPLPLDSGFQPKPAFYAMLDAFQSAAARAK